MRTPTAQLEDLLVLIVLTPFGARAREHGLERWAIDCARRAMAANIDVIGPRRTGPLELGLARATARLGQALDPDEVTAVLGAIAQLSAQLDASGRSADRPSDRHAAQLARAATFAIADLVSGTVSAENVAAAARQAFEHPELEASAQFRRLLIFTRLLPSGTDLLIRLDYAESLGQLPETGAQREWLETQRGALMANDESSRHGVVARCFDLVFLAELGRIGS